MGIAVCNQCGHGFIDSRQKSGSVIQCPSCSGSFTYTEEEQRELFKEFMEKQSKNTGTVVVTWPSDFERGQEEREYKVAKSNLPGVFCRCHGCDDIFLVLGAVCSSCGVVANYVLGDGAQGGKVWACDSCQMGVSTVECECGTR